MGSVHDAYLGQSGPQGKHPCVILRFNPTRMNRSKEASTAHRFDDDEYRTKAMQAELAELAQQADYARQVIETGDPECEAAIEALEQGWAMRR